MKPNVMRTPKAAAITAVIVMFLGISLWAIFTDLDYGVHAEGAVASLNPNVEIQHNAVARVTKVHVVEGSYVKKGQPLLTLDQSESLADALRAEAQRLILRLQVEAMKAEIAGVVSVPYPKGISPILPQALVQQSHRDAQEALTQRLQSYRSQLGQSTSDIAAAQAQLRQNREQLSGVDAQIAIVQRQLKGLEPMLEERLIARTTVEDQRVRLEDYRRSRASLLADQERLTGMLAATEAKRSSYQADRLNDLKKRLSETLPQLEGAEKLSDAADIKLTSNVIAAPVDGQVINVKVNAVGEVVRAGDILMELVPSVKRLFIDAKVMPAEIETVHAGIPAEIHFVTLPSKSTPMVDGRLTSIASNSTLDEKSGMRFYIARVEFTGDVIKQLGIEPALGMPVQVLLKGGRRTVMSYLVDPFKALFLRAMKEQ